MGENRLAYLDAPHILFGHVADAHAAMNDLAVRECDCLRDGVDLADMIALILLHLAGQTVKVVVCLEQP